MSTGGLSQPDVSPCIMVTLILLTNCDLNKAMEADVVDVCVEEDVCEEAPYFSALVWVIFEEGAETFYHS